MKRAQIFLIGLLVSVLPLAFCVSLDPSGHFLAEAKARANDLSLTVICDGNQPLADAQCRQVLRGADISGVVRESRCSDQAGVCYRYSLFTDNAAFDLRVIASGPAGKVSRVVLTSRDVLVERVGPQ